MTLHPVYRALARLRAQPLNPLPTIVNVSPSTVSNLEDQTIVVTSTSFLSTPNINLGVGSLDVQFVSSTKLIAIIPAQMAPGIYDLLLRNVDGQIAILTDAITIKSATFLLLCVK